MNDWFLTKMIIIVIEITILVILISDFDVAATNQEHVCDCDVKIFHVCTILITSFAFEQDTLCSMVIMTWNKLENLLLKLPFKVEAKPILDILS